MLTPLTSRRRFPEVTACTLIFIWFQDKPPCFDAPASPSWPHLFLPSWGRHRNIGNMRPIFPLPALWVCPTRCGTVSFHIRSGERGDISTAPRARARSDAGERRLLPWWIAAVKTAKVTTADRQCCQASAHGNKDPSLFVLFLSAIIPRHYPLFMWLCSPHFWPFPLPCVVKTRLIVPLWDLRCCGIHYAWPALAKRLNAACLSH